MSTKSLEQTEENSHPGDTSSNPSRSSGFVAKQDDVDPEYVEEILNLTSPANDGHNDTEVAADAESITLTTQVKKPFDKETESKKGATGGSNDKTPEEKTPELTNLVRAEQPQRALSQPGAYGSGELLPEEDSSSSDDEDPFASHSDNPVQQQLSSHLVSLGDGPLLTAVKVDHPDDVEAQLRDKIMRESVVAQEISVVQDSPQVADGNNKSKRCALGVVVLFLVMALGIGVGVWVSQKSKDDTKTESAVAASDDAKNDSPLAPLYTSTLEEIRDRGFVRCGVYIDVLGFTSLNNKTGELEGINIEQCKAAAIAVFNDASKYESVQLDFRDRFIALATDRSIDFLTQTVTFTMSRDVFEPDTQSNLAFSIPFLYSGMAFAGVPEFVDCADALETYQGNCRDLRLCVGVGTTHELILKELLPATFIVDIESSENYIDKLQVGECNVVVDDAGAAPEAGLRERGYTGPYKMGINRFSKEPLSLVTRGDDPEWSDLVNLIVQLPINAEAQNLTQAHALDIAANDDFEIRPDLEVLMIRMVAGLGHYGEMWERTLGEIIPRDALNFVHSDANLEKGLLYSFPVGNSEVEGSDPHPGKTLERIAQRGHLVCGVIPRLGFAEFDANTDTWEGLDTQFCRALNAAIHRGVTDTVVFVDVSDPKQRYAYLEADSVDVIAGERISLQNSLREATTGKGYSFSAPYFYDDHGDAFGFATKQSDNQWSDWVFWIVHAIIYAEEMEISSNANLTMMPTVNLFGQLYKPMFLDCITAVGNYADIYERTMEEIIPRKGANLLNQDLSGPQHFPMPIF